MRSGLDQRLIGLGQTIPPALVHADGQHGGRLMHAREVVVLRCFIELHVGIVPGANPLCRVDGA